MTIPTLKSRIERHRVEFEQACEAEVDLEQHLTKLRAINLEPTQIYTAGYYVDLNFTTSDIYEAELKIIPTLSTLYSLKWKKEVSETEVKYEAIHSSKRRNIYFYVKLRLTESCTVTRVATGKTVKEHKLVEVPEFEYVVDCAE